MAAGQKVTIFKPTIKVAPVGTALPANSLAAGLSWTGWTDVPNTEEGALITVTNPTDDIMSDENNIISVVPSGEGAVNFSFVSVTPEVNLMKYLAQFGEQIVAGTFEIQTLTVAGTVTGTSTIVVSLYDSTGIARTYNVALAASDASTAVATKIAAAINADTSRQWDAVASTSVVTLTSKFYANAPQATSTTVAGITSITGATTTPGVEGYRRHFVDPKGKTFMIGVEGTYGNDSLYAYGGMVRAFGYEVQQTEDVEMSFRRTGEDAVLKLAANVRALKTVVSSAQIASTGITSTDDRFDMFSIPG